MTRRTLSLVQFNSIWFSSWVHFFLIGSVEPLPLAALLSRLGFLIYDWRLISL